MALLLREELDKENTMTTMNIADVVNMVYPGQLALGNVAFGQNAGEPIFITKWTVPGEPMPSRESLEAMIPSLQSQFDFMFFVTQGTPLIAAYVDTVAQQRNYDNAVSCASYVNSTIMSWQAQALAFVWWRDSVYSYAIAQQQLMQSGQRSIPTFEEFQSELPAMVWPS